MLCLAIASLRLPTSAARSRRRDSWPQWRGPSRTGALTLDEAPRTWPAELKKGWSVEVGEGYSSPIAGDGRIFVHARRDPDEVVSAIDLATGSSHGSRNTPLRWRRTRTPSRWRRARIRRRFSEGAPLHVWHDGNPLSVERLDRRSHLAKGFSSRIDTSKLFCGRRCHRSGLRRASSCMSATIGAAPILALDPVTGKENWITDVRGPWLRFSD